MEPAFPIGTRSRGKAIAAVIRAARICIPSKPRTGKVPPNPTARWAWSCPLEGMRIVGLPDIAVGSEVRVALHSNAGAEPIALEATVLRDDGDSVALQFCSVTPELHEQIGALMNENPSVRSDLQAGQSERIVIVRIDCARIPVGRSLSRPPALGPLVFRQIDH